MKKNPILIFLLIFEIIAVTLTLALDDIFYFFNFTYIGLGLSIGIYLHVSNSKYSKYGRNVIQLAIGLYMLIFLGLMSHENMMIEGFWYYLFLGSFTAAVIHYAVAKIFGPLLFGRGWCGYACWTTMILDLLPYKHPNQNLDYKRKGFGYIRYILFIASFVLILGLFIFKINNLELWMFYFFIIGNIIYYAVGIALAFALKDNRAFCKYICPTTVFLKISSYFSLLRLKHDEKSCINCNKCVRVCPMEVDIFDNSRKRENGTECILCLNCIKECPNDALDL